ncbi:MAG: PQQ-binding-like beta-propeller repeat protein, partial [Chloroflexota bacterium]
MKRGDCVCEDGYTWRDPDDTTDLRCVRDQGGNSDGGLGGDGGTIRDAGFVDAGVDGGVHDAGECAPNCGARECGPDPVCGTSCGSCASGTCSSDGQCPTVDPLPGDLLWSYATGGYVYSSPAIGADGTIYVGSMDNQLYALNPDGTLKWSYAAGDYIESSPAIGTDGTIYVGSYDNKLYALNPDGTLKWSYATGDWVRSSPAIAADGTIYVGYSDNKQANADVFAAG